MGEAVAIILASIVGLFFFYSKSAGSRPPLPPRKHDPRFSEQRLKAQKEELEADIDLAMESRQSADELLQEARDTWERQP